MSAIAWNAVRDGNGITVRHQWNAHSLIETAKANNIEPSRYLAALFKKLPLAQTVDDYEALLPWNIVLGAP